MDRNTYSLIFGKEPIQLISRASQIAMVTGQFTATPPAQQVYLITGVRGSGKTVLMTEIGKRMKEDASWLVVELNPERDMLEALASKLASEDSLSRLLKSADINLSLFGFGLTVHNSAPISDIETALSRILETVKKHGKKVLVTIDEAVSNQYMRTFISAYQILIRQDLPLFLLMTGLYENISELQNQKTLTFLYRAPRIEIRPLNIHTVSENYRKNFQLEAGEALRMAKLTKGYSFAFQVLGYFTWEHGGKWRNAMDDFKLYLFEFVYEKIWSELSDKDRKTALAIAKSETGRIREIREALHMETNQFNPYRKRLIRKGILDGSRYGYVEFTLPLFDVFIIENYEESLMT